MAEDEGGGLLLRKRAEGRADPAPLLGGDHDVGDVRGDGGPDDRVGDCRGLLARGPTAPGPEMVQGGVDRRDGQPAARLVRRYDPRGAFRNDYLDRTIGPA